MSGTSLIVIGCILWIFSYMHNITLPIFPGMKAVRIPDWAILFFGKSRMRAVPPDAISPVNLGFFLFSMYLVFWGIVISLFSLDPALYGIIGIFLSMGLGYISSQLLYKITPYYWEEKAVPSDTGPVAFTENSISNSSAHMSEKSSKLTVRNSRLEMIFEIIWALSFMLGLVFIVLGMWSGTLGTAWILGVTFFGLLAYLGWAMAFSTIQITRESITVTVFYGRFRIFWDEVEKITLSGPYLALTGHGKRIVLSLEHVSVRREKLLEYFHDQIALRNIEYEEDFTPKSLSELTHQNTRVRWW